MKSSTFALVKIFAYAAVGSLALAVLAYFFAFPAMSLFGSPAGSAGSGSFPLGIAFIVLLAGIAASAATLLAVNRFFRQGAAADDLADAISQPLLLVDGESRYMKINSEAESRLGLDRERDVGKALLPEISRALAASSSNHRDTGDLRTLAYVNNRYYKVAANAVHRLESPDSRGVRLLALRDVTEQVRIQRAISDITQTMALLDGNSAKISSSSVSLSQGATEQASSLAAITNSLDEFSKKIQGNTETSAKGTQLAAQAREAAERSGNEIENALSVMNDVQEAGIRVARIVKLIDDIAFQTNLLALNAAVEAARAGRQGKGFAVVADEVRNLAGRSAKAAKDTASMMEDVTERIGNASAYISKLGDMLKNIVQDAIRMADSSASASAISAEQASGILHVNQELGQMNSVTHSTMAAAEQTATGIEVMTRQVQTMKRQLESLAREYSIEGEAEDRTPESGSQGLSINLFDDPDARADDKEQPFFSGNDYGRYDSDREDAGYSDYDIGSPKSNGKDWDLKRENFSGEPSLSTLLESDGYGGEFKSFLSDPPRDDEPRGGTKPDPFDMKFGKNAFAAKNSDGDRVVNPNQNIILDDSEFGRY